MLQELTSLTSAHPYTALATTVILLLALYAFYRLHFDPLSHIPGPLFPRLTPFWLYTHSYFGTESRAIHALHTAYGPIVRISPTDLSIADGSSLNTIYVSKGGFLKAQCYENFDIDGHASIFSALDPKHRAPRAKAVVGLFAMSAIRERGLETIEACSEEFVERVREAKEAGGRVNVLELARSLAVDAVTGYLFGKQYGGLEERKKRSKDADTGLSAGAFVDTFVAVGRFFLLPNNLFLLLEKLSVTFFPDPVVDASMLTVDDFVAGIVSTAGKTLEDPNAEDTYQRRLLQAGFSESETKAQCKDLIFAGTDSTGMNLATACWHLAKNQDLLTTLKHELTTSTTPPSHPLNPTTHPTLHATLLETLRISMANPTRFPRLVPTGGITLLGIHIPSSSTIGAQPYSLHFNPEVFPQPFEFRPERWLGEEGEVEGKRREMQTALIPFGLGPRQCIARNLATTELEVALVRVVASEVLEGCRALGEGIEIREWFNSKVVGEGIWVS